ncbi:MAG: 50S ribosomal protein P1 [Candidatus Micrarchaeaceae archaeon]
MEYIYAALLLDAAGKEINEESISNIIKTAGITPDEARIKALVNSLKGVNIKDVIKNAQNFQPVQQQAAPAGASGEKKAEKKEEEQKKTEEEAAGGLASLFG